MQNDIELLRISTAGSVDDGKSTLIGRMLHDCHSIFEDQYLSVKKTCDKVGKEVDLAFLLDGLKAEREQGITIDVAYRYFSTPKRRFIIADVPGHEQYTRNMMTGASNSNLALILCDARKGLLIQSKRHLFIAALLGIPHVLVVVNKMDLVDYDQKIFNKIKQDFSDFCSKLNIKDLQFTPVSALKGDMVVDRGHNMPWYNGRTILDYLENIQITADRNLIDFRFPVQSVVRPNQDFRGYTGKIEGGIIRRGDRVRILPANNKSSIKEIYVNGSRQDYAFNPLSALLSLEDELDISRGDMIVKEQNMSEVSDNFEATVCWMSDEPLAENKNYIIKHTSRTSNGFVERLRYRINMDDLHREEKSKLYLNEMGRVYIRTQDSLSFDPYQKNRHTGNFIIIDPISKNTVGAGIINKKVKNAETGGYIHRVKDNKGGVMWFTGLSGSGKSTIADKLYVVLKNMGVRCERLDGDIVRQALTRDLGFSKEDRDKNIERVSYVAGLLSKHDVLVLATFISPYKEHRKTASFHTDKFLEVFVDAPLDICIKRDVKGLYKKALNGEIDNFTGISAPYEAPDNPHICCQTHENTVDECVEQIIDYLYKNKFLQK
ncbi:MAG TPA: adenylyl-sulfate kinase [Patescibacteria group bacterium]|nr:adenylyl-sulfate kinase [Patescibacteria group bacterium]